MPVARAAGRIRLFSLGETTLVSSGRLLYRADARGLHQDVALMRGFGGFIPDAAREGGEGFVVVGSWPDGAWLEAAAQDSASLDPVVTVATYRWVKDRWRRAPLLEPGELVQGLSTWRNRSALALLGGQSGMRLAIVNDRGFLDVHPTPTPWAKARAATDAGADGDAGADAPPVDGAPPSVPDGGAAACNTELRAAGKWGLSLSRDGSSGPTTPRALLGFEDGSLLMAGTSCVDGDARWLVERWDPKKKQSTLDELPRPKDAGAQRDFVLAGSSPTDVWLIAVGGSSLLHFDGKAWQAEALSGADRFHDLRVAKSGAAWLVTADALMRRTEGQWVRIELPSGLVPLEVAPDQGGVVWVRAREASGEVLLATDTQASPSTIRLPDDKSAAAAAGDILRYPASPVCDSPYVLLIEHVKPTETKFPEVVAALREVSGVELVTEASQKWSYLGARVPDMQTAARVVELAQKLPGAKPAVFCHEPRVGKKIPLE